VWWNCGGRRVRTQENADQESRKTGFRVKKALFGVRPKATSKQQKTRKTSREIGGFSSKKTDREREKKEGKKERVAEKKAFPQMKARGKGGVGGVAMGGLK